jgi:hypothetical protein
MWLLMTVELGIEMISFLIVLIRVTNDFSITSPHFANFTGRQF